MSKKQFQLIRYNKGKKLSFEVLVNPETVIPYREGKLTVNKVLYADEVYKNFSKGEVAQNNELHACFETTDKKTVLKYILDNGEYQFSTKEKRDMLEKKKLELMNYVKSNYLNPQNKLPHPMTRIEQAFKQIKYSVSLTKPVMRQIDEMFSQLCEVLPLKKSMISGKLIVKHAYVGKCQGVLKDYVSLDRTKYTGEGCEYWVECCPGDYDKLFADLHRLTKGDYDFKMDGAEAIDGGGGKDKGKGKKGKKGKKKRGGGKKKKGKRKKK